MDHRTISLASLCLTFFLVSGCKGDGVPKELKGKWVSTDLLFGTTTMQFRDGEIETSRGIYEAKYQTDEDGVILEVKENGITKKVRVKINSDNTIDYAGVRFRHSNN